MLREVLKSEIRRATITEVSAEGREGIEIPSDLVDAVGLCDGEKVMVASMTSGTRLETYVQAGDTKSGRIILKGTAAHLLRRGDRVTIMAFGFSHEPVLPQKIMLNERNEVQR
jgi:aspartate 1-decarboxylase